MFFFPFVLFLLLKRLVFCFASLVLDLFNYFFVHSHKNAIRYIEATFDVLLYKSTAPATIKLYKENNYINFYDKFASFKIS